MTDSNQLWTIADASRAWGISIQRAWLLYRQGRIPGARIQDIGGKATITLPPQEKPPARHTGRPARA